MVTVLQEMALHELMEAEAETGVEDMKRAHKVMKTLAYTKALLAHPDLGQEYEFYLGELTVGKAAFRVGFKVTGVRYFMPWWFAVRRTVANPAPTPLELKDSVTELNATIAIMRPNRNDTSGWVEAYALPRYLRLPEVQPPDDQPKTPTRNVEEVIIQLTIRVYV